LVSVGTFNEPLHFAPNSTVALSIFYRIFNRWDYVLTRPGSDSDSQFTKGNQIVTVRKRHRSRYGLH
jgi:hypothetical protein